MWYKICYIKWKTKGDKIIMGEKLVLEVFYDVEEDGYSWKFHHKLNAFLVLGIIDVVKEELIEEIRDATKERYGEE